MAQSQYQKPLPAISSLNQPYWDGLRKRELKLPKCDACATVWYPPAPLCPKCWSRKFTWTRLSGRGRINSWVVFHQSYFRGFDGELPYNVAEVELDEGPRFPISQARPKAALNPQLIIFACPACTCNWPVFAVGS